MPVIIVMADFGIPSLFASSFTRAGFAAPSNGRAENLICHSPSNVSPIAVVRALGCTHILTKSPPAPVTNADLIVSSLLPHNVRVVARGTSSKRAGVNPSVAMRMARRPRLPALRLCTTYTVLRHRSQRSSVPYRFQVPKCTVRTEGGVELAYVGLRWERWEQYHCGTT